MNKGKDIWLVFLGFGFSAGLLTLIQVPFDAAFLAWVSIVPFILICGGKVRLVHLLWISYLVSACYWLGNLYWIGYVTIPAYILLCLYLGLYWPVMVVSVRYCRVKRWPLLLCIPIIFCGAEMFQGIIFTGFSWRLLAHSQYANLSIIQIADVFGESGVSFLVAMVNACMAVLIIDLKAGRIFRRGNIINALLTVLVIIAVIVYGNFRVGQAKDFVKAGPLVGSVQPNVPSKIKESQESAEEILEGLEIQTRDCINAGAELVIWPETMVLASLNENYLRLCRTDSDPRVLDGRIRRLAKTGCYILAGAHAAEPKLENDEYVIGDKFNSAYLYRPDGSQYLYRYDKIHLVPFGEFIPFKETMPFIHNIIVGLSPYEYDYSLTHGSRYTMFPVKSGDEEYHFGVLICYEDTDARIARKMVVDDEGKRIADWLVNISNDGWYVRFKDGQVLPSEELAQRMAISVFRAVENRVSIVRSVNTGISCLIDSSGRIKDEFVAGNLPLRSMSRQGVAGWFVDRIEVDSRVTFFSKYGRWLDFLCAIAAALVIIVALGSLFITGRNVKK